MFDDSLCGFRIMASPLIDEFKPKLEMRPCGCSLKVLDEMNDYLLKMFGGERSFLVLHEQGIIIAHPNNIAWLKRHLDIGVTP
jgi:hypothetical protein